MSASLARDVVVLACAISAGVHGALAPAHGADGAGAGLAFAGAAGVLALTAVALTRRPAADWILVVAALSLGGLIAGYVVAVVAGLPPLHPAPEPVDGLGVVTKTVEAVGLVAAVRVLRDRAAVPATTTGRSPAWTRQAHRARSHSS